LVDRGGTWTPNARTAKDQTVDSTRRELVTSDGAPSCASSPMDVITPYSSACLLIPTMAPSRTIHALPDWMCRTTRYSMYGVTEEMSSSRNPRAAVRFEELRSCGLDGVGGGKRKACVPSPMSSFMRLNPLSL